MQDPYKNLGKALLFSRNQVFLSEKLKTLTSSNYHRVQYFLLKFRTRFLLTNIYKKLLGIFFILFRSWVVCKNQKDLVSTHSFFYIFNNNSRSKQNKKIPNTLFRHCFVDIIRFLYSPYHPKIIRHILKNVQKTSVSGLMTLYD